MEELFDSKFMESLNKLIIAANTTVLSGLEGRRKSSTKGSSVEFSDYREYVYGDDLRRLDWNTYARLEKMVVKLFNEEKEAKVNIFLDVSKSMDYGEPNKSFISRRLTLAIIYIALKGYDSVSLYLIKDDETKKLNNIRGKDGIFKAIEQVRNIQYTGESSLYPAIKKTNLGKKEITFVISDFFAQDEMDVLLKFLRYMEHKVFLYQVLSKNEINPHIEGNVRLVDSENESYFDISLSGSILDDYYKAYKKFVNNLKELSNRNKSHFMQVVEMADIEEAIKKVVFTK